MTHYDPYEPGWWQVRDRLYVGDLAPMPWWHPSRPYFRVVCILALIVLAGVLYAGGRLGQ